MELTPEMWVQIATLSSSVLLEKGAVRFLTVCARAMSVNRMQKLVQLLEQILVSESIEDEFSPVQTLHAVTVMLQIAHSVQQEEQQRDAGSGAKALPDMVCQNQAITSKLRKICTQVRHSSEHTRRDMREQLGYRGLATDILATDRQCTVLLKILFEMRQSAAATRCCGYSGLHGQLKRAVRSENLYVRARR